MTLQYAHTDKLMPYKRFPDPITAITFVQLRKKKSFVMMNGEATLHIATIHLKPKEFPVREVFDFSYGRSVSVHYGISISSRLSDSPT